MQPSTNKDPGKRFWRLFGLLAWLAVLGLAALNRQNIIDWWRLRDYQPPVAVAQLANQDGFTAYGRRIFYVNHTAIEPKTSFAGECPNNGGEQTIVLGCYHGNQAGIFLLSVSDPRLNGVEQVTAAHEMLHGAYDSLSGADKQKVNAMLLDYYSHGLEDQRVKNTIDAYKKTEPKDIVNEMHSVFGSEVANLPAGLEQYYKRYFTDRTRITAYASAYQAEFTSRQSAVAQDDTQLAELKQRIKNDESDLQSKQSVITTQRNTLAAERANDEIVAYNAGVPAYNTLVDAYNAEVDEVHGFIGQYNALVSQRNAIALEVDELAQELSTNTSPISP